jgi:hypothetical protein
VGGAGVAAGALGNVPPPTVVKREAALEELGDSKPGSCTAIRVSK